MQNKYSEKFLTILQTISKFISGHSKGTLGTPGTLFRRLSYNLFQKSFYDEAFINLKFK